MRWTGKPWSRIVYGTEKKCYFGERFRSLALEFFENMDKYTNEEKKNYEKFDAR